MLELKNEAYRIIHDIAGRRRGTLLPSPRSGGMEVFANVPMVLSELSRGDSDPGGSASGGSWRCWPGDELNQASSLRPEGGVPADMRPSLLRGGVPAHLPAAIRWRPGPLPGAPDRLDTECLWRPRDLCFSSTAPPPSGRSSTPFERAGRKPTSLETASNR